MMCRFPVNSRFGKASAAIAPAWVAVFLVIAAGTGGARSDPTPLTPIGRFEQLHNIQTPMPYAAVAHDQTAQLIVAHRADTDRLTLSIMPLNDQGIPGEPVRMALPAAAQAEEMDVYALGLALHPSLPLLYVTSDAEAPGQDADPAPWMAIHRLHVFLIRPGGLTLLRSVGDGLPMAWGQARGQIAVDGAGRRLFLAHLRDDAGAAIGSLALDRRGMPQLNTANELLFDTQSARSIAGFSGGSGYVAGSEDAVVFAAPNGPATWDRINRRAHLVLFPLPDAPRVVNVGGRTDETAVYIVGQDSDYFGVMHQAQGYLTLWPRRIRVSGDPAPAFRGIPEVMPTVNAVAVADRHGVYVFDRDPRGMPNDTVRFTSLERRDVRVLAWSERFQKLYVINP